MKIDVWVSQLTSQGQSTQAHGPLCRSLALARTLLHVAPLAPEKARLDQLTNPTLNPLQIVGARARSVRALIAKVF